MLGYLPPVQHFVHRTLGSKVRREGVDCSADMYLKRQAILPANCLYHA